MTFRVFDVPETLQAELLAFYGEQTAYPLSNVKQIRTELSQYLGVYILFYTGNYELYQPIAEINERELVQPIYIGKAVPKGARTGVAATSATKENNLYKRLNEHARSIAAAENIDATDFSFKVIPTGLHLVPWVESLLISHYAPVWNAFLDGFGNHDPGRGRYNQRRSVWDQIHPGRPWAERMLNLADYNLDSLRERIRQETQRQKEERQRELSDDL